jgi:hypothetical protein
MRERIDSNGAGAGASGTGAGIDGLIGANEGGDMDMDVDDESAGLGMSPSPLISLRILVFSFFSLSFCYKGVNKCLFSDEPRHRRRIRPPAPRRVQKGNVEEDIRRAV